MSQHMFEKDGYVLGNVEEGVLGEDAWIEF